MNENENKYIVVDILNSDKIIVCAEKIKNNYLSELISNNYLKKNINTNNISEYTTLCCNYLFCIYNEDIDIINQYNNLLLEFCDNIYDLLIYHKLNIEPYYYPIITLNLNNNNTNDSSIGRIYRIIIYLENTSNQRNINIENLNINTKLTFFTKKIIILKKDVNYLCNDITEGKQINITIDIYSKYDE